MGRIVVVGGALAGIAAAARLAKAGHEVTLVERTDHLGGRLAEPGAWSPVLGFPAPLRDLMRKSGRAFDGEFGKRGLSMVGAPPTRHVFADGTELDLPTDRAEQWHLLTDRYSPTAATRWRDLLDTADGTWQVLRPLGLEGELIARSQVASRRRYLNPRLTIEDAARAVDHPHLGEIVRDVARSIGSTPHDTPAWLVSRLSVERTFGRWVLVDAAGAVQPATVILEVLAERLAARGVTVLTGTEAVAIGADRVTTAGGELPADAIVSAVNPWEHDRLAGGGPLRRWALLRSRPALAPRVAATDAAAEGTPAPVLEVVRHTRGGSVVTVERAAGGGVHTVRQDFTDTEPSRGYGVRWRGAGTWLRMPGLRTPGQPRLFTASAASRGGNEPWAQLLSGALATYAVHALLTGEDIRPSNRDYKP